jgi:hypothetical protein
MLLSSLALLLCSSPSQAPSNDGLTPSLQAAVGEAVRAVDTSREVWRASNREQALESRFEASSVRVSPASGKRALELELAAWGREGARTPAPPAVRTGRGTRVEYRRGALTEWYENGAHGLEQGFTLAAAPGRHGVGSLELELRVADGWSTEVLPGGRDARFLDGCTEAVFNYSGLRAWDALGTELDASLRAEGSSLVIAVDDRRATYPLQIDPLITTEEAKLGHAGPLADEGFGYSVSVSGDRALVGVPFGSGVGNGSGEAYVFVRSGTSWAQQAKLTPSGSTPGNEFGCSVSLYNNRALIGARFATNVGRAFFFRYDGANWAEEAILSSTTNQVGSEFGFSVALEAAIAFVSAPMENTVGFNSGTVQGFKRTNGVWNPIGLIYSSNPGEKMGWSIALSGDRLLVGVPHEDSFVTNGGRADVWDISMPTWVQETSLWPSPPGAGNRAGWSVALEGNTAILGIPWDDDSGTDSGSASVFRRQGGNWFESQILAGDGAPGDAFGTSVSLDGDYLAVGAPGDDSGVLDGGAAYVFERLGTTWLEAAEVLPGDGATGDAFGSAVSVDGDTIVCGAWKDDDGAVDAGSAYVFRIQSGPVNYCTAGTSANGCAAALSASGTPSATAASGFLLSAAGVEGSKDGLFFFSTNGRQANTWGSGTSYQCVVPPVMRAGLLTGVGTSGACDGSFAQDLNALWCATCPSPLKNPGAGVLVQAQLWYRDPFNTSNQTTSLSDAIEFAVEP